MGYWLYACFDGDDLDLPSTSFLLTLSQVFQREHFFRGSDNDDQLLKIMRTLGTDLFDDYLRKYSIHFETDHAGLLEK